MQYTVTSAKVSVTHGFTCNGECPCKQVCVRGYRSAAQGVGSVPPLNLEGARGVCNRQCHCLDIEVQDRVISERKVCSNIEPINMANTILNTLFTTVKYLIKYAQYLTLI